MYPQILVILEINKYLRKMIYLQGYSLQQLFVIKEIINPLNVINRSVVK